MKFNQEIMPSFVSSLVNFWHSVTHPTTHGQERPLSLSWEQLDNFVIVTALGTHVTKATVLSDSSKTSLSIDAQRLVLMPGEARRARFEQASEFCQKVVNKPAELGASELSYLIELFEAKPQDVAAHLELSMDEFNEIIDEDLELSPHEASKLAEALLAALPGQGVHPGYEMAC